MAPRRVIADSDDDDEDFSPIKLTSGPEDTFQDVQPEMEPLSPQHQPASPLVRQHSLLAVANAQDDTSGSTSPSFFANIHEVHQVKGIQAQQSRLVENIVRQSQKASRSSGDVSLPTQGQGRGRKAVAHGSSAATDVTSPVPGAKSGPRKSQLAQISDATELTTPRKSAERDEWDVPSSGDEGKRHKKNERSSGPSTDDSSKIYVAQSNLSASQKRQYRKVQVLDSHSGESAIPDSVGQMQPPSNYKSSCATTVAVSTPSRYASSGPRLPYEIEQSADVGKPSAAIDLTLSSPDAITVGGADQEGDQSPVRRSSVKRKRPVVRDDDDELGLDENFFEQPSSDPDSDYDTAGRKPTKKAKQPANSSSAAAKKEPKKRGRKKKLPVDDDVVIDDEVKIVEPLLMTAPPTIPEINSAEEKPKKKRGRPRKSEATQPAGASIEPLIEKGQPVHQPSRNYAPPENEEGEDDATAEKESRGQSATVDSTEDEVVTQTEDKREKGPSGSASPLKETDRNVLGRSQSTVSDSDKSMSKSMASSQAGKMSYRVGLSKKSRIAPLLKIIRK
ncbi:hypothetical protein PFICI_08798 [Pestalotiopsis fici W106-1]|uniref:Uncharacterized protein n=1 Tax=Pestalotiopsis fici (strain W106-1 / CGMCC3.15140) TaxID=1229662 RepID=W3WYL9_PESFW|nr:uncharacterized protein PFICI_08798 [Pestalotiopsis fici W106-1]ETS78945.1 hypothetical protein PFICI_08798 [Pestalotiopsis fici W106-1]